MNSRRFDVLGIGNAIVDILAPASDAFLQNENIDKGTMTLIDEDRAQRLFGKMTTTTIASGGCAANTMAGIASLGGKAAYIGRVNDDQLGALFARDMKGIGVHFSAPPASGGAATASCIIFITPDGQRSMNTFLGACTDFTVDDLDDAVIRDSAIIYMEGYLFDKAPAQAAFKQAAATARAHGNKVALSLSDPFCVTRHRDSFARLVKDGVDILFANEAEAIALYEKSSLDDVFPILSGACELAIITRGAEGAIILSQGQPLHVPAEKSEKLVDTTGAGDLFAAGFLYGYSQTKPLAECGRLGALCAAEVISHVGPRPQVDLKEWVAVKMRG